MNLAETVMAELGPEPSGDHSLLRCPRCANGWLHQRCVSVYERREDSERGLQVTVQGENFFADSAVSHAAGNPSQRRQGVRISFVCETCSDHRQMQLCIAQHKGMTQVFWELGA